MPIGSKALRRVVALLRYLTAGESHGPALIAIVEGMPSGLPLTAAYINRQLARRQGGYGRGARMKIESDTVSFLSGVRDGLTLGSPYYFTRGKQGLGQLVGNYVSGNPAPGLANGW